jgi:hypothetical protein
MNSIETESLIGDSDRSLRISELFSEALNAVAIRQHVIVTYSSAPCFRQGTCQKRRQNRYRNSGVANILLTNSRAIAD